MIQEYVKSFYWVQDEKTGNQLLVVQRTEVNGLSIILYSDNLFKSRLSQIFATDVKDFYMKGDYLFFTKKSSKVIKCICKLLQAFLKLKLLIDCLS